ncbi:hypothetical protein B1729_04235 [Microbacterium sp. B35-04]|uniref:hypothetical protein n=1 Tax=unclassified Microbacterium TaxID=2609290 RepID=UPI0013D57843|nr:MULTISPECIES: hypothetical protein [unclassified Microbacterium]KAF2414454.1 hypothetical protein B1729_04235 [Microbacterium sp. B35-04]KAF2417346.1 hypothetical protein B2K11_12705 [Microbacterium sp. B35-30]
MSQPAAPDAPQNPPVPPGAWAPPAAPPFGPPAGTTAGPAQAAGGQPGVPPGWSAPPAGAYAPPPGYAPPVGYAVAPGTAPAYGGPPARRSSVLGVVALALALVATVGAGIMGAIASYRIGLGAGREITARALDADFDWSILTPVRDWVMLGEVAFWVGTALGVWALVQGVVAIVTARGRGAGIAAVIVAALGPIVFGGVVQGFLTAGLAAGTGMGS